MLLYDTWSSKPAAIWSMTRFSPMVPLVEVQGAVALPLALVHLLGGQAEEENIFVPQLLVHLHIGAYPEYRMVSAPFIMNFMLPVPLALLPAVEICSDSSLAGISFSARDTR